MRETVRRDLKPYYYKVKVATVTMLLVWEQIVDKSCAVECSIPTHLGMISIRWFL